MNLFKRVMPFMLCVAVVFCLCACSFETSVEKLFGVKTDITVEEQTVYDADGIKITVKGLSEEIEKNGRFVQAMFYLQFEVENTSSRNIYVTTKYVCANGFMIDAWDLEYYNAGVTGEFNLDLVPASLQRYGISLIKDLELVFLIGDADTYEDFATSAPIKLTTSADPGYVQPSGDEGSVLYDGAEAKIVAKMTEDGDIRLYVENKMNQNIHVTATCVAINGAPNEGYENTVFVLKGKKGYTLVGYPRDTVDADKANTFTLNLVIRANVIKDIGNVTVTLQK